MTGKEFGRQWELRVDKPFTGFYDPAKQNRLFEKAIYDVLKHEVKKFQGSQKVSDELTCLFKTGVQKIPRSNCLRTEAIIITDIQIKSNAAGTPIAVVTTFSDHLLAVGDVATIDGQVGLAPFSPNPGIVTLIVSDRQFHIDLSVPANGTYENNSGCLLHDGIVNDYYRLAAVKATFDNGDIEWCRVSYSDRKISSFGAPTTEVPKVETANCFLKILPLDQKCTSVEVDYFVEPPFMIDVNDDFLDLDKIYPRDFLYFIMDWAAKTFSSNVRDQQDYQIKKDEIVDNP